MKKLLLIGIILPVLSTLGYSQCCNVVSSNGINAITSNGICATTALGASADCGETKLDTDKDGVPDEEDVCPNEAGVRENKGCPAVSAEEVAILDAAVHGIKFESGKDIITLESYLVLNNVVKVLNSRSVYKLSIEGHTDSQGDDAFNLELSKKRAAAVKNYLIEKGIAPTRLSSEGYGETVPVADNSTPEGRAENRRVDLKVKF